MSEHPVTLDQRTVDAMRSALLSAGIDAATPLELVVPVDSTTLTARELSGLLTLVDRLHGRLAVGNLRSYAHNQRQHLHVANVESGSLEFIFQSLGQELIQATPLLLLFLALKALPAVIQSAARGLKDVADAYKSFQDAKFTKLRRQQLAKALEADETFRALPPAARRTVTDTVAQAYEAELPSVSGAQRSAVDALRPPRLRAEGKSR